jgi:hypothetical protein
VVGKKEKEQGLAMKLLPLFMSLAMVGAASSQDMTGVERIVISPKTPNLSVKMIQAADDGTPFYVEMQGSISVRATVSYGWFDGDEFGEGGTLMVHLLFSKSEWSKIPRRDDWQRLSNCDLYCEFHIDNDEALAEALFDVRTLKRIRDKKLMQVRKHATLTLTDISFGGDCGIHYGAKGYVQKGKIQQKQVAMNSGFRTHC